MTSQANVSVELTQNDHHQIAQLLKDLSREQLLDLVSALGLSYTRFRGKEEHLLGDIISGWLRMEDGVVTTPCWAVLITALEEIGQNGIATRIRQTFSRAAKEEISSPPSSILPSPDSQAQAFNDGAAASASCLQAKFPYLNTEHLSQEEKNILIGRLEAESKRIEQKFATLVIATVTSLEARRITVERVIVLLKSCGITFEPTAEYRNIDHVLITAIDHWSFFNYRNLEALIECLGDDADRERLAIYKSDFKEYCKRRLCEVPIDALKSRRKVTTRLHVKVDRHWNILVEDVYLLAKVLSDILDTTLLLLNVEEGCIKIDFDCRCLEEDDLLPLLSDNHKDVFMQLGITKLCTDRQVFYEQHDKNKEQENEITKVSSALQTICNPQTNSLEQFQGGGDPRNMSVSLALLPSVADIDGWMLTAIRNSSFTNGLAIIIGCPKSHNKNLKILKGVEKDMIQLEAVFKQLKFVTLCLYEPSKKHIERVIAQTQKLDRDAIALPPTWQRIVVTFSGHGDTEYLHTKDSNIDLKKDIVLPLMPLNARQLSGLSKLFFIDACRGEDWDEGIEIDQFYSRGDELVAMGRAKVPSIGNFLIAWSTLPDMVALESAKGGIWMQALSKELVNEEHIEKDIQAVFTAVDARIYSSNSSSSSKTQQQSIRIATLHAEVKLLKEAYDLLELQQSSLIDSQQQQGMLGQDPLLVNQQQQPMVGGIHNSDLMNARPQYQHQQHMMGGFQGNSDLANIHSQHQQGIYDHLQHQHQMGGFQASNDPMNLYQQQMGDGSDLMNIPPQLQQQVGGYQVSSDPYQQQMGGSSDPYPIHQQGNYDYPQYNQQQMGVFQNLQASQYQQSIRGSCQSQWPQQQQEQQQQQPVSSGEFRGLLNHYEQTGKISKFSFTENTNQQNEFQSSVTVSLPNSQEVIKGKGPFKPTKAAAREAAAEDVCKKIKTCTSPQQLQHVRGAAAATATADLKKPSDRTAKSKLKEYFDAKCKGQKTSIRYETKEEGHEVYRSTVFCPIIGHATGDKYSNKKDAEHSAAKKALQKLE